MYVLSVRNFRKFKKQRMGQRIILISTSDSAIPKNKKKSSFVLPQIFSAISHSVGYLVPFICKTMLLNIT
jgi:hypothetical protein